MIWAQNDNPAVEFYGSYGPSRRALFLPVIIVIAGYIALVLTLYFHGKADSALFRMALIILFIGAPLMVIHAMLRAYTVRISPMAHAVYLHRGFPRGEEMEVPYSFVESVDIRKGLGGYLTGAGTIVITLVAGQKVAVCDLENAEASMSAIHHAMGLDRVVAFPADESDEVALKAG